jgi:plasmid stability protein
LLKVLAARHGRSVSAEAALAIKDHLKKHAESLKEGAGQ